MNLCKDHLRVVLFLRFFFSGARTRSQTNPSAYLNHNQMPQHPKSVKIPIWDAFSPLKTPHFNKTHLGYNLRQKCTPNPFKFTIWDAIAPQKMHPSLSAVLPHIPELYHGLNVITCFAKRGAELLDIRINGSVVSFIVPAPDGVEDLVAC